MADGFEPYHVPQQSRRDKLRVTVQSGGADGLQACAALVPLYDPSLDLINCANLRPLGFSLGGSVAGGVKEEAMNLMNFGGGMNSSSHMYVDPQLSVQLNPSPIPEISGVYPPPPHWPEAAAAHNQDSRGGSTATGAAQILSLSLSSHPSSNLPLELNLERYNNDFSNNSNNTTSSNKGSGGYDFVASNGVEFCKSSVPLGPFTGYASVLKGSRFLKPAQQLLEELCGVGRRGEKTVADDTSSPTLMDDPSENGIVEDSINCTSEGNDQTRKKSRLLTMLDEVYKRYKQYYQQMQTAIAAFESVAGLSSAAPFANLALKAMSRHFTCLKNTITDQLQFITKSHGKTNCDRNEALRLEQSGKGSYNRRPFNGAGFNNQPVWRPQRGLPERAVAVLRTWLFDHFLHPYPTDTDKLMLAKQTGLSRNQVSNWFINARVRLWKPMVEEIHMLEMRENQKASQRTEQPPNRISDNMPTSCSMESENASTSIHSHHRIGEVPLKGTHDSAAVAPGRIEEQMKLPYDNLLHSPHLGVGLSNAGSVSLTLGLHQNGIGLPESYAMNAAPRFGLETGDTRGYIMGGFAVETQQFGRDHIGGQLTHDFVG